MWVEHAEMAYVGVVMRPCGLVTGGIRLYYSQVFGALSMSSSCSGCRHPYFPQVVSLVLVPYRLRA